MKGHPILFGAACWLLFIFNVPATVFYVDVNSANPVPPYAGWSTASTDIQSAIDASSDGDLILVTNGLYNTGGRMFYTELVSVNDQWIALGVTNRVVVNKALTVESVNGPAVTVIQGYQVSGTINDYGAVRCVYLTNNATLTGFTLTNGATWSSGDWNIQESGGGIWCESSSSVVSNCVFAGNSAYTSGGGINQGVLNNCTFFGNSAVFGGGAYSCTLNNCILSGNVASYGGGASECTFTNCVLQGNTNSPGPTFGPAPPSGGGAFNSTLVNCIVAGNLASYGDGGGANGCALISCTVVENLAAGYGGGFAYGSTVNNCIVRDNTALNGANYIDGDYDMMMIHCCTDPMPSGSNDGGGNITNNPAFANLVGGDFHLQSNSPCINAGNNSYVTGTNDLDGNPRIVGGTVDIGAYEYQTPTSIMSYAWRSNTVCPRTAPWITPIRMATA